MEASSNKNTRDLKQLEDEFKQLKLNLPKESWLGDTMYFYQDFWYLDSVLECVVAFQTHFQAYDTDFILADLPKTGTTWLKSLLFAIVNRKNISMNCPNHPLRTKYPHELVPHLEFTIFEKITGIQLDLTKAYSLPRLFGTHVPYQSLPMSIKNSECKIVYVCRNPFDTFVSSWHYFLQYEINKEIKPTKEMMEELYGKFCKGVFPYGPYDDHVLAYWNESLKRPEKVFFLEYEGFKKEPEAHLRSLAEFLGYPFSNEEEGNVIDEIIELCSLKSLKEMEANNSGKFYSLVENKASFRKGEVGDWVNYLTPAIAEQFDSMKENLKKAGFSFKYYQM